LQPFGRADNGVIEAVRHSTLPIVAIQWHPERSNPASSLDKQLLEEWKKQCVLLS
jgi:N5-(cytidine 5'-diphosphoramidyl)-L-glutamine hydrolase